MRAGIYNFLASLEPAPFVITTARYDVEGEDTPPLMTFDADVSQFSSTLTRFVLDALLERNPSEFPYSAYLIGFKRAWIFSAPFDTHPISIEPPSGDHVNPPNESIANTEDAIAFLANLVKQRVDDQPRAAE